MVAINRWAEDPRVRIPTGAAVPGGLSAAGSAEGGCQVRNTAGKGEVSRRAGPLQGPGLSAASSDNKASVHYYPLRDLDVAF